MLGDLMDLAKTGGRIAREHFTSLRGKDVVAKRPRDYVSHVDRLVEETLVSRIRARFPNHQVLGEEGSGGITTPETHRPLWIIDPIDGTTNFIHGIPVFAVSIAIFATRNWRDVTIDLWGPLAADIKLPVLMGLMALLGWLPTWLVMRGRSWQVKRKLLMLERPAPPAVAPATIPAPPPSEPLQP